MFKEILSGEESILNEFGKEKIWKKWRIMKNYEKWSKLMFSKILHGIHDSTGHGVHNTIIYNIACHNFQFLFCFLYITHFLEFMNRFHNLNLKTSISKNKSDYLKTIRKLKIMRDYIEDEYVSHNMTTRNMKSVQ